MVMLRWWSLWVGVALWCCCQSAVAASNTPKVDVDRIIVQRLALDRKLEPSTDLAVVNITQSGVLHMVDTLLTAPEALNASMERVPELLYKNFWEMLPIIRTLAKPDGTKDPTKQLDALNERVAQLPTHLGWPLLRRTILAAIVQHRVNSGAYSEPAQAAVVKLLVQLWELHRDAAARKGIIDFFHLSKAGGTSFCQLSKLNGCRTQSFAARRNCLIREFDDVPRWVNNSMHNSLSPEGLRTPWFANYGKKRNPVSCRLRKRFMLRRRYNIYANEFTLHGAMRNVRNVHLCAGHLNVLQLRHPHTRLVSHLQWVWALYDHHFKEQAAAFFPSRASPHWGLLMPAATHNYLVRSILGEAAYHLPPEQLTDEHLQFARLAVSQFDVLLLLEQPALNQVVLEMALGWGLGFGGVHARTSSQLHEVGRKGLPPDLDDMLKANSLDLEVYRYGYHLAHLDAVVFDLVKGLGLGVGYEDATISTGGADGDGDGGGVQVAGEKASHPGADEQWELAGNATAKATCGFVTLNDKGDSSYEWLLV